MSRSCSKWKTKKTTWVFFLYKYRKFWSFSSEFKLERKTFILDMCVSIWFFSLIRVLYDITWTAPESNYIKTFRPKPQCGLKYEKRYNSGSCNICLKGQNQCFFNDFFQQSMWIFTLWVNPTNTRKFIFVAPFFHF